jgi:hypothetical protein
MKMRFEPNHQIYPPQGSAEGASFWIAICSEYYEARRMAG